MATEHIYTVSSLDVEVATFPLDDGKPRNNNQQQPTSNKKGTQQ